MRHHIDIYLISSGTTTDKRFSRLTIGLRHKEIVAVAIRSVQSSLTVLERNGCAVHRKRRQTAVINHLHIIQIDIIYATSGGCSASRVGIRCERHQHISCLRRSHRVILERHGDTLPAFGRSGRIIDFRISNLHRRIVARLRVLIATGSSDNSVRTSFVGRVSRVSIRWDVLGPEHQRVRVTHERRVITAIGGVGEIIVLRCITCRHRTCVNLSVRAVTVCRHAEHRFGLQARTILSGRTRTLVRLLGELTRITVDERSHATCSRTKGMPARRFIIGPSALKTTVHKVIITGSACAGEGHRNRSRQVRYINRKRYLRRGSRERRVATHRNCHVRIDGADIQRTVLKRQSAI